MPATTSPFHDLNEFIRLPRVGGLALSPDGDRLIASVSEPDDAGSQYITSLWAIDPEGRAAPRRLTHSTQGETSPVFRSDATMLFLSARPRPPRGSRPDEEPGTAVPVDEEIPALWALPAASGEPWLVASPPGGVSGVATAPSSMTAVYSASVAPGRRDDAADGSAVVATGDRHGHHPLVQVDLASGEIADLAGDGSWSSPRPASDGRYLYALQAAMDRPPRRWDHAARLAGPARRGGGGGPGPVAPVGPRRSARLLERLALTVEPVGDGRPWVGGAPARPGIVDRLRPGFPPPGMGSVGRGPLHRPDDHHRCGPRARRRRRGWWSEQWGWPDDNAEHYRTWSPDRFDDRIRTPM